MTYRIYFAIFADYILHYYHPTTQLCIPTLSTFKMLGHVGVRRFILICPLTQVLINVSPF